VSASGGDSKTMQYSNLQGPNRRKARLHSRVRQVPAGGLRKNLPVPDSSAGLASQPNQMLAAFGSGRHLGPTGL